MTQTDAQIILFVVRHVPMGRAGLVLCIPAHHIPKLVQILRLARRASFLQQVFQDFDPMLQALHIASTGSLPSVLACAV